MTQEEIWLLKEKYQGEETDVFLADCEHLKAGEPLGYIIGWVPFLDCKIWLDSKPLIPRPETEYWVEQAINLILMTFHSNERSSGGERLCILDLCAGSGCIGVAVAKAHSDALVTFAEIDPTHLPTIRKNLSENLSPLYIINDIQPRKYNVVESDLFGNVDDQYDFILSNPPYIDPELDRASDSVKKYEPHQALYGGDSGTEIIERIIKESPEYLTSNGQLWLEHEPEQSSLIQNLGKKHDFAVTTYRDQYDSERYSVLVIQ